MKPVLVDTHAHLDFDQFSGEEEQTLERAAAVGVTRIINVGTTLERSRKAVALAEKFENVWAAVGIHPHDATEVTDAAITELATLAKHEKVVAIGEIGFDAHYEDGPDEAVQEAAFCKQAAIATSPLAKNLPLIIHSRDAERLTMRCLRKVSKASQAKQIEHPGVIHCFSGSRELADVVLSLGWLISLTATITYPKNDALREIIKTVPLERIMVETDCPFLAPQDKRGQRNEPAYVVSTAGKVAELKGLSLDAVAAQTTKNAERLFGLPPAAEL